MFQVPEQRKTWEQLGFDSPGDREEGSGQRDNLKKCVVWGLGDGKEEQRQGLSPCFWSCVLGKSRSLFLIKYRRGFLHLQENHPLI